MIIILRQHRIYRSDLKNNPHALYLFGDNRLRIGFGGQASAMRDEPNSFGIATKHNPGDKRNSYFDDSEETMEIISQEFSNLHKKIVTEGWKVMVIPSDGIGTGLAKMPEYCPKAFEYLNMRLNSLTDTAIQ